MQATPGATSVTLSWTASANAVSYLVYRSTGDPNFSLVGSPTSTTFTDSSVSPGTDYFYEIVAVGANGAVSTAIGTEVTTTISSGSQRQTCGTPPPCYDYSTNPPTSPYPYVVVEHVKMPAITGVWLKEISLPGAMKIAWTPYGSPSCWYEIGWSRTDGVNTVNGSTGTDSFRDTNAFTFGTSYTYTLTAYGATTSGMTDDGNGHSCQYNGTDWYTFTDQQGRLWYHGTIYDPSDPVSITVTPQQVVASDDGTVDARYDLRFSTFHYLDFPFVSSIYKGGLFVGNAPDNSRMGRSFFRFNPAGSRSGIWAGSVSAYLMDTASGFNSATVGLQGVTDNGWAASGLKWSTAPAIFPSSAASTVMVQNYLSGWSLWCHWMLDGTLWNQILGTGSVNAGMAVTTESADANGGVNTWLYFNKKEVNSIVPPTLLYATGAPLGAVWVGVNPTSVQGGTSATGTVYLNGVAPTGGAVVSLSSSDSHATVPTGVTVPAGASSATFTITTSTVTTSTSASIGATYTGPQVSAVLTVTP